MQKSEAMKLIFTLFLFTLIGFISFSKENELDDDAALFDEWFAEQALRDDPRLGYDMLYKRSQQSKQSQDQISMEILRHMMAN